VYDTPTGTVGKSVESVGTTYCNYDFGDQLFNAHRFCKKAELR
jgi:hypothetical protein